MLESLTRSLIQTFGILGVGVVVFAESGLLVGFFLPGDSLLFTAGLLASEGLLNLPLLLAVTFVAAVVGDSVGYSFGRRAGSSLYKREDSRFFKHEHLERATEFYERHGGKTIVMARFIPIVRTFAPIVAGATAMKYRRFIAFNVIGGFVWAIGVTMLGYWLGQAFPWIGKNLEIAVVVIVAISLVPVGLHLMAERRRRRTGESGESDGESDDESVGESDGESDGESVGG